MNGSGVTSVGLEAIGRQLFFAEISLGQQSSAHMG